MIIGPESILRRLPSVLDRKQYLFWDAIRLTVEMIDIAHLRLQGSLSRLQLAQHESRPMDQPTVVGALLDSWSIVDSVHRLSALLWNCPGIAKRNQSPELRKLQEFEDGIENLRNAVQHLSNEIPRVLMADNWSALGSLSWCSVADGGETLHACTMMPGAVRPGERPIVNPVGRKINLPVGLITLSQDTTSVCLSDVVDHVAVVTAALERNLEQAIREQVTDVGHNASDVIVCVTMKAS